MRGTDSIGERQPRPARCLAGKRSREVFGVYCWTEVLSAITLLTDCDLRAMCYAVEEMCAHAATAY